MTSWTILKLIEWTSEYFTKNNIPNPRLDAELLLSHVLKKKRIELYLSFESIVSENDLAIFKGYIQRRIKREPLQYITGVQEFWGIPIKVTPAVLIPRPETEILVEHALKFIQDDSRKPLDVSSRATDHHFTVLDLCTGSGAIIAALASELPDAKFTGVDISEPAIEIAKHNIEQWKDRVELMQGNLLAPLCHPREGGDLLHALDSRPLPNACRGKLRGDDKPSGMPSYDLIISNPPYIPEAELATLQPEIRDYEPKEALVAGQDGLSIISKIISSAPDFLNPNGLLAMEIGDGQAEKVRELIISSGKYAEPEIVKDYSGIERIVTVAIR